jgi:hypothetical protein
MASLTQAPSVNSITSYALPSKLRRDPVTRPCYPSFVCYIEELGNRVYRNVERNAASSKRADGS